ncbi:hemogen [Spea bombifrons]|uniref:hemogen n=1 Tax=Spea bombifrons TaxID=233779 RepID=UPI00234A7C23|nr:hemogen [Spea bombifrons]
MEGFGKDHHYSEVAENPVQTSEHREEKQDVSVVTTRRLRDRELLKRKKEEAQEKDTFQEETRSKRQRKGTGRGRRKQQVKQPEPQPEPEPEPEPQVHLEPKIPEEHTEVAQEHLEHHEDPVTSAGGDVTLLIYEEEGGHIPNTSISSLTVEKEEVPESEPVAVSEVPEGLTFHVNAGNEEQQYYTPLL